MTVKELMNILKDYDEKAEIKIENWDGTLTSIEEVIDYSKELNEVQIIV